MHSEACPEIGPICAVRDEPPQLHDQMFYLGELRAVLALGLAENFGLEAQLPLRLTATTVVYRTLETGSPFVPDYPNIHHRNETLAGIGDPWLRLRTAWDLGGVVLAGAAGVSLPLGRTEPNPFALGDAGLPHQHVQFGTGTLNPLLEIGLSKTFEAFSLGGYVQAQLGLYENPYGYRPGHRLGAGLAAVATLFEKLVGTARVDVANEEPERWNGLVLQDGNLGRTDLLVGAALEYPLGGVVLSAEVKVPVYQHLVQHGDEAAQLSYPAVLTLGVRGAIAPPGVEP